MEGECLATEQEEVEARLASVEQIDQQGTTDDSEEGSKSIKAGTQGACA